MVKTREYLNRISNLVQSEFEREISTTDIFGLEKIYAYSFKDIGIRFRSSLFCLGCSFQKELIEDFIDLAVGIELLQTSTLILDDIFDNAKKRNEKDASYVKFGYSPTIVSAELMHQHLIKKTINHCKLKDVCKLNILSLFNDAYIHIYKGQFKDISPELYINSISDYELLIEQTTGRFIRNSLLAGYAVGQSTEFETQLSAYGFHIGQAYQIRDDIIDFIAVEGTGKDICLDIKEGKRRIPLILLKENLIKEELVSKIWNKRAALSNEDIENVVDLIFENGIDKMCVNKLSIHCNKAHDAIKDLPYCREKSILMDLVKLINKI